MKLNQIIFIVTLQFNSMIGQSFFEHNWKTIIDTTWDNGYTIEDMLTIYDSIWTVINNEYACFQFLETNWDSLHQVNREEIESGVSTGRFTAILNHFGIKLKESHTYISDVELNQQSKPKRGTPLIYQGGWARDTHFGAGLSPLPDSNLIVYDVIPNHPLGLEVGDVILGYEGVPWKKLYKLLLEMEFPTGTINIMGSNDISFTQNWLMGAGMNWHLFETIDIIKYGTNDTLHLPTSLLEDKEFELYYTGQIPIDGVYFPTSSKESISWGIVSNRNIGYIYIWSFFDRKISTKFYNAIDSLINVFKVDGLIFDIRANSGGYFRSTDKGFDLLFKQSPSNLGLAIRESINDYYTLRKYVTYQLPVDSTKYFNGPIAVLTSSSSISAADFFALRLTEHPNAKLFGTSTSGSFSSLKRDNIGKIIVSYSYLNGFIERDSLEYLSHTAVPVDYEVYFLPDDVKNGTDTVVKEALEWISENIVIAVPFSNEIVFNYSLYQNFPNPFNPSTTISYSISKYEFVTLKVYDILGREVANLVNEEQNVGRYKVRFEASHLSSGVYFYRLQSGDFVNTKKLILLR